MKFSPETLLRIYLDGSFTEEAQAEFDALMRRDPVFAEKVTDAIAQRLGPVPEASVEAIASRLESKAQDLWIKHKPSPWLRNLKIGLKTLAAMSIAAASYWGYHQWFAMTGMSVATSVVSQENPGNPSAIKDPDHQNLPVAKSSLKPPRKGQVKPSIRSEAGSDHLSVPADTQGKTRLNPSAAVPMTGNSIQGSIPAPTEPVPSRIKGAATSAQGDALRVAIHSDKPGQATITVFDSNGDLVRHLFQGLVQPGDGYVDWDGRNDLGLAVAPGSYNVVLDLNGKKMSGVLKILPK